MPHIEIDDEIFEFLKGHAVPFEDTPNTVLRRLLGFEGGQSGSQSNRRSKQMAQGTVLGSEPTPQDRPFDSNAMLPETLAKTILKREFGDGYSKVSPYKTMYGKDKSLVYFQNFTKARSRKLWYRLSGSAWRRLRSNADCSVVCFANPAEKFAYIVPVFEILAELERVGLLRDSIEVNIDTLNDRWKWHELDWHIDTYYKQY